MTGLSHRLHRVEASSQRAVLDMLLSKQLLLQEEEEDRTMC